MSKIDQLVLVTGGSGYVGINCVKVLLEAGYSVRATVRDPSNVKKAEPIKRLDTDGRLTLFKIELESPVAEWVKAVKDCDYVLHVASPFFVGLKESDRESIVRQATEGVRNVLEACKQAPSVKRVVLTSSLAAVGDGRKIREAAAKCEEAVFTEADWPDAVGPPKLGVYYESKMKAEQLAWEMVKQPQAKFELSVICPGFIVGPLLSNVKTTSCEVRFCRVSCKWLRIIYNPLLMMLNGKMPLVPHVYMPIVDVRDVAHAHLVAMTEKKAAGERFIVCERGMFFDEIAQTLAEEFKPKHYKVATRQAPKCLVTIAGLFNGDAKDMARNYNHKPHFDNQKMTNVLEMSELHDSRKSLVAMTYSMIEMGILEKKYRDSLF